MPLPPLVVSGQIIAASHMNAVRNALATKSFDTDFAAYALQNCGRISIHASGGFEDGTLALPGVRFADDLNTGLQRSAADTLELVTGGVSRLTISAAGITPVAPLLFADGTAGAPSMSFASDTDTGMMRFGANAVGIVAGAVVRLTIDSSTVTSTLPLRLADGSAASPAMSFASDTDTGIYRSAADTVNIGVAGASVVSVSSTVTDVLNVVRVNPAGSGNKILLFDGGATDRYGFRIDSNSIRMYAPYAGVVELGVFDGTTYAQRVVATNANIQFRGVRSYMMGADELYALGIQYGTGAGSGPFFIGASNALNPDLIFSNAGGTEVMRLIGSTLRVKLPIYGNFANDAAAAAGGINVGELYRNGSIIMQRVA